MWFLIVLFVRWRTHFLPVFMQTYVTGAPNDGLLLNTLKTPFRLSKVRSDLEKCILSGVLKLYLFGDPRAT